MYNTNRRDNTIGNNVFENSIRMKFDRFYIVSHWIYCPEIKYAFIRRLLCLLSFGLLKRWNLFVIKKKKTIKTTKTIKKWFCIQVASTLYQTGIYNSNTVNKTQNYLFDGKYYFKIDSVKWHTNQLPIVGDGNCLFRSVCLVRKKNVEIFD